MELEYGRPLPPELHTEIHKCLPLPNAIHVLVNASSWAFADINSPRMHRNIQRIKTSLKEYIKATVLREYEDEVDFAEEYDEEEFQEEFDQEELWTSKDVQWEPQLDALFRYGGWLTSKRQFCMDDNCSILGMPENYVEEMMLHFENSRSPKMMLHHVQMSFQRDTLPIPAFMKPLLNKKEEYQNGRMLFGSVDLGTDDGRILHIFDGELQLNQYRNSRPNDYSLRLFVMNKMDDEKYLFKITLHLDPAKKFIRRLKFSKWNMQSLDDIAKFVKIEENGNKLAEKRDIYWNPNLDMFLRRGARFNQFQHFEIKERFYKCQQFNYAEFMMNYVTNTIHPEDFLESFELKVHFCSSKFFNKFLKFCDKGIGKGGKFTVGNKNLHILSAKTTELDNKLEFTLANEPTNGAFVFDFGIHFGKAWQHIRGIKVQKRKNDGDPVELKCEDQIELETKKRKEAVNDDDENGPTYSGEIMKQ